MAKKMGRPSKYTDELADEIFERIATGESVRQICLLDHMPDDRTFYRWLLKDDEFCRKYARAKEAQADRFNEELTEIADDSRNDWIERENARTGQTFVALNDEAIARAKLRVETRKWLMGKHKPKKYGDAVNLKHSDPDGGPVKIQEIPIDLTKLDEVELAELAKISAKLATNQSGD